VPHRDRLRPFLVRAFVRHRLRRALPQRLDSTGDRAGAVPGPVSESRTACEIQDEYRIQSPGRSGVSGHCVALCLEDASLPPRNRAWWLSAFRGVLHSCSKACRWSRRLRSGKCRFRPG
jgi:hypothetical protein